MLTTNVFFPTSSHSVLNIINIDAYKFSAELKHLETSLKDIFSAPKNIHQQICDLLPQPIISSTFSLIFFFQKDEDIQIEFISDDDDMDLDMFSDILELLSHELSFLYNNHLGYWVFSWSDGYWFNPLLTSS